jgi:hypothetical protein
MSYVTVSPNFTSVDLKSIDLSMKIDIFEDQMNGWFLDHVELLASPTNPKAQHAGFAILTFAAIYVESIACFIKGSTSDGKSSEYFTFGMGQIFAGFDMETFKILQKDFYRQVRCGQLHQGLVRGKVSIARGAEVALSISRDAGGVPIAIQIDPWLFLEKVREHFQLYVNGLRDVTRTTERLNFETWFDTRGM